MKGPERKNATSIYFRSRASALYLAWCFNPYPANVENMVSSE